jgi:hypothetical protein
MLGWRSVAELSRGMSEREFRRWMRFAATHRFPFIRQEAYLAQIASVIAQTTGNEMTINDFILDFSGKSKKAGAKKDDASAIAAMLPAVGVRKLGQGRKKKAA